MKIVRRLGLTLVAAMGLVAYTAGGAGATILESSRVTLGAGTTVNATLEMGDTSTLSTTGGTELKTCTQSEVHGKITNPGGLVNGKTETVSGPVETLIFNGCNGVTVNQAANGNLEVHNIAGTDDGTLTASGFTVTIHTLIFGLERCTFGAGTKIDLGTLTGNPNGNATVHVDAAVVLLGNHNNTFLCPGHARWKGKYEVTSPTKLQVTG